MKMSVIIAEGTPSRTARVIDIPDLIQSFIIFLTNLKKFIISFLNSLAKLQIAFQTPTQHCLRHIFENSNDVD